MRRVGSLALLLLLSGCLSGGDSSEGRGAPDVCEDDASCIDASQRRHSHVVVADIDTGINVYHERFAYPLDPIYADLRPLFAEFVDATTGQPPIEVTLSMSGSFEERLEADQAIWDSLQRGVLYYFVGTRVMGISFESDAGDENPILDYPDGSHGTATAGAVVDANPSAFVVLVEGVGNGAGELWAMQQPWIDVTTMSYGPVGSPPTSALEETGTHAATRAGWTAGKLTVGAADNTPAPAPNDQTAGPPWVIGVAGDHVETHCRDHVSGNFPDVTANFTQSLPTADSIDERRTTSGTSFATPTTAGTLSRAVQQLRDIWQHEGGITDGALAIGPDGQRLTNWDVRAAMNATAYYFDATACQPGPGSSTPVNPAAPWAQMGWGHVGPEIVQPMVELLKNGTLEPTGKDQAAIFQEALFDYRVRLWGDP